MSAAGAGSSLAWMAALAVLVLPLAWWLARGGRLGALSALSQRGARQLELREQLSLGPRERIALVRAGDRLLVLGVTAHGVTVLHDEAADAAALAPPERRTWSA